MIDEHALVPFVRIVEIKCQRSSTINRSASRRLLIISSIGKRRRGSLISCPMSSWLSFYAIRFDGRSAITCNSNIDIHHIRHSINSFPGRITPVGHRWESVATRRICIDGWNMCLSIGCISSTERTWSIGRGKSSNQSNDFSTYPTTFAENTSISIRTNVVSHVCGSPTDVSDHPKAEPIQWFPTRHERSYRRSTRRVIAISKHLLKSIFLGFNHQSSSVDSLSHSYFSYRTKIKLKTCLFCL